MHCCQQKLKSNKLLFFARKKIVKNKSHSLYKIELFVTGTLAIIIETFTQRNN